jgi:hypothetical protein
MFIFLDIQNDANNTPCFHVSFDRGLGDIVADACFPATKQGAFAMGRHIAATCPGATEFACSSDIDFADEYGIKMTGDDICKEVLIGMGCTVAAF